MNTALRLCRRLLIAAALLNSSAEGAVSILNPGFEDSATWQTSGWRQTVYVNGGGYDPKIIENSQPAFGNAPFGQRYVLLEAPDIGNAVLQYVTGFETGQTYELSFWAAASFVESVVQIGGLIGVQDPAIAVAHHFLYNLPVPPSRIEEFSVWAPFSITFTAQSDTMTLWVGQSGQGFGPVYFPPVAVDQVSLRAIPEPSLASIGSVIAVLMAARRRRPIP